MKIIIVSMYFVMISLALVIFGMGVLDLADKLTEKFIKAYKNNNK